MIMILYYMYLFPISFLVFTLPSWHALFLFNALFLSSVLIFTLLLSGLLAEDLSTAIFMKFPVQSALGQMLKADKVVSESVFF